MGILTEAYKQHPVENKFITPIDFASIKDIPESHAWVETSPRKIYKNSTNNNNNNKTNEELTSIPVIELNNPNVVDQIFQACENWGMFQIINHGILGQTLEKVELEAKKLFNLPIEEKMKVLRSPDGATGYGSPRITPFFSKLMWCEGFTIIGNSLVDHAMQLWPNDYQGFCVFFERVKVICQRSLEPVRGKFYLINQTKDPLKSYMKITIIGRAELSNAVLSDVMEKYEAQLKLLADKLMGFMLKSLNIPKSEMNWVKQDPNNISTALQLNSYPSCPDPTRTMGLAEHTDTFLFTILHQTGNASGLQVYKDGLGWVSVDPVPGALVVNVGDLLHIISNGRFPSVVHRAVVNNEKQRMSMAYFYGPPLDYIVAPFVGYSGCESPCFESMTVKEYVSIKSKLLDSALSSITK